MLASCPPLSAQLMYASKNVAFTFSWNERHFVGSESDTVYPFAQLDSVPGTASNTEKHTNILPCAANFKSSINKSNPNLFCRLN